MHFFIYTIVILKVQDILYKFELLMYFIVLMATIHNIANVF